MRYVIARLKQKQRADAYRNYISEGIRMISVNTAYAAKGLCGEGCEVSYLGKRLDELLTPKEELRPGEATERIRRMLREG